MNTSVDDMTMIFRQATLDDCNDIWNIITDARHFLRDTHIPQWQEAYPTFDIIHNDIERGWCYVLEYDHTLIATCTLMQEPEPNYAELISGSWGQGVNMPYTTLHRLAIARQWRGHHLCGPFLYQLIQESKKLGYRQIRIDTHKNNVRMQHIIHQYGFHYAGVVFMRGVRSDQRNAYQLFL